MNLSELCTRIIKYSFYLLFIIVPLILAPWNYELFEFNKMMVTYGLTVIILSAWVLKMIDQKEVKIAKTPLDIPIFLFLGSQFFSSLFSIDRHVSWFGYYSRFNGGMWSLVSYTILYYAFVSNFVETFRQEDNKTIRKNENRVLPSYGLTVLPLLYITMGTAFLVSLYGIAESFGIDKHLWVQDVQHRVFSTLGQPNWLAAYLAALIPLSIYFSWRSLNQGAWRDKHFDFKIYLSFESLFWLTISAVFFWTILLTRSRSGYAGFLAADVVLIVLMGIKYLQTNKRKLFFTWLGIIHIIFFTIVFFVGTKVDLFDSWLTFEGLANKFSAVQKDTAKPKTIPVPTPSDTKLLDVGISESTDIRSYVWKAAVDAWKANSKNFLIGTGTETFAFTFYQFRPKEHNMTSEWDFLYNKAHNEYLNYLATTGILGLGSYLVFLSFFVLWFIKVQSLKFKVQKDVALPNTRLETPNSDSNLWVLQTALFAGWVSILVTNFFGFSVVIMQIFLFIFPALIFILETQITATPVLFAENGEARRAVGSGVTLKYLTYKIPNTQSIQTFGKLSSTGIGIILFSNLLLGWWADVVFAKGYRANRNEDYNVSEPLLSVATLLRSHEPLYQDEFATALAGKAITALETKDTTQGSDFAKRAIIASDKATSASPHNVNYWKTKTKIYYSLSAYDRNLLANSIKALEEGYKLSPNDPKIMYNLAILYGQAGQVDMAIGLLKKGIEIKPDYRDLYNGLRVIYEEIGKRDEAMLIVTEYLTKVDPGDLEFKKILEEQ